MHAQAVRQVADFFIEFVGRHGFIDQVVFRRLDAVESSACETKLHRARESAAKYHDRRERHSALPRRSSTCPI